MTMTLKDLARQTQETRLKEWSKEEIESLEYEYQGHRLMLGALNEYTSVLTQSEYKRIEPRIWKRMEQIEKTLAIHKKA